MNFKQLEYIMTIYYEGGIHKAAAKLFISQPALSQHLQRVEEEIGIRIFERGTNPLRPTYAGQHYLNTVERLLYEHRQEQIWIDEMNHNMHGKLSIGISAARSMQFLPKLLPEFRKIFPQIEIDLHEEPMFSFQSMMAKGEIDFALMAAEIFCDGLVYIPLVRERFFLAVPPESEANEICRKSVEECGVVRLEQLAGEPFILLRHGGHTRKVADELFAKKGIIPDIALETTNADLAFALSGAGYGLSFVSGMCAEFSNAYPRPNCYPMNDGEFKEWTLGVAYRREHYQTKAMAAFIDFTRKKIAEYPFAIRETTAS